MKNKKRILAMATAIMVTACSFLGINAEATAYWPDGVAVDSGAAIVLEMETGTVLYEKNADQPFYPASITKIMTALLALENCSLDEIVTFSAKAVYENEGDTSHISRELDEKMTLESALYGMMLESANECAWAIGEHVGGNMPKFVEMMNAKAKELGCTNTHFANPNGLPDSDHIVSARDMSLIARAAYQIPKFQEICGTRAYTIPADNKKEQYNCNNTHGMISNHRGAKHLYEYALGGKTGYTDEAGNTLVTYARKDGMTLLCVILNSSNPAHYNDTERLFEYCFQNFTVTKVADYVSITDLSNKAAAGKLSDKIDLIRVDKSGIVVLPKTASFIDAKAKVIPAPKGSGAVARVEYTYAGRPVGGANIVYENAKKVSYPFHNVPAKDGGTKIKYFRIDFKMIFMIIFGIGLVLLVVYILHLQSSKILLYKHRHTKPKKRRRGNQTQIRRRKTNHRRKPSSRQTTRPASNRSKKNTNIRRRTR